MHTVVDGSGKYRRRTRRAHLRAQRRAAVGGTPLWKWRRVQTAAPATCKRQRLRYAQTVASVTRQRPAAVGGVRRGGRKHGASAPMRRRRAERRPRAPADRRTGARIPARTLCRGLLEHRRSPGKRTAIGSSRRRTSCTFGSSGRVGRGRACSCTARATCAHRSPVAEGATTCQPPPVGKAQTRIAGSGTHRTAVRVDPRD